MKVSLNSNQNFCGIYQSTLLNNAQFKMSDRVTRALAYTDTYQEASANDIDISFVKPKNNELVRVVYTNSDGMQYKISGGKKNLETTFASEKDPFVIADKINKVLKRILDGKYKAPEYDLAKIIRETIEKKPNSFVEVEDIIMDNPSDKERLDFDEELEKICS